MSLEDDTREALARVCAKVSPDWMSPGPLDDPFTWGRTALNYIQALTQKQREEATEFVVECVRCCARGREADAVKALAAAEVIVRQVEQVDEPVEAIKKPSLDEADAAWGDPSDSGLTQDNSSVGLREGEMPAKTATEAALVERPGRSKVNAEDQSPRPPKPRQRRIGKPRQEPRIHIALFVSSLELEQIDKLVTRAGCESRAAWLLLVVQRELSAPTDLRARRA
jgi:hypothetical protein